MTNKTTAKSEIHVRPLDALSKLGGGGLFICIALFSISSCKNFFNGAGTAAEIQSAIAYANAPSYTISIDYPSGKGVMKSPAGGEDQKKKTDKFVLHFEPSTDSEFISEYRRRQQK